MKLPAMVMREDLVAGEDLVVGGRRVCGSPVAEPERGSASPVVVALVAVVVVLTVIVAQVGAGLVAGARASGAADLSALAAAQRDRDLRAQGVGSASSLERACRVAADVSRRNGATLTKCVRGEGSSVLVFTSVPIPAWPASASARSRAGPAWG